MNGIEWIVEAHGCSPERLSDLAVLKDLYSQIASDLQLKPVGETLWHQFPLTGGITGLCLLAESHLACHTFPEFSSFCLNLFCCVPREPWDFERALKEMFRADSVNVRSVVRPYAPSTADSDKPADAVQPLVGSRLG